MAIDRVNVYDGNARFSQLAERAESGGSTVITVRGRGANTAALALELPLPIACCDGRMRSVLPLAGVNLA